jgi:transposase InsO family protein
MSYDFQRRSRRTIILRRLRFDEQEAAQNKNRQRRQSALRNSHGGLSIASISVLARNIFNTDRGSQFTGSAFTGRLPGNASPSAWTPKGHGGIACSSTDCGAASSTRRCTCSLMKPSAKRATPIDRCLELYNSRRPHSSLDDRTLDHAYFTTLPPLLGSQTPAKAPLIDAGIATIDANGTVSASSSNLFLIAPESLRYSRAPFDAQSAKERALATGYFFASSR